METKSKLEKSLAYIVNLILDSLTPELAKSFILSILDKLEDLVKKTDNKIDDIIIISLCNKIRKLLDSEKETLPIENQSLEFEINENTKSLAFETDNTETNSLEFETNENNKPLAFEVEEFIDNKYNELKTENKNPFILQELSKQVKDKYNIIDKRQNPFEN